MPEHSDESADGKRPAEAEEQPSPNLSLPRALRQTACDLKINLQNCLTVAGVVVIPLAASWLGALGLGAPVPPAIAFGLLVPFWFFVLKAGKHAESRWALFSFAGVATVLIVLTGFGIASAISRTPPTPNLGNPAQTLPPQQHYETHGAQSPIMPDNKGAVTITNQQTGAVPKKDKEHK